MTARDWPAMSGPAISGKGQPHGGGSLCGNAFAPAGEAEPFGRGRLDADLVGPEASDLGDARDHRRTMRADLGALAGNRDVEMRDHAAALGDGVYRVLEEERAVAPAPARVGRREVAADIAEADAAQNRVGQRMQTDI